MLGTFKADVKVVDNETISVDGNAIKVVSNRDPLKLPWAELGIDIVIEGTGVFVDGPGAGKHIQAGARKVIITALLKVLTFLLMLWVSMKMITQMRFPTLSAMPRAQQTALHHS